LGRQIVARLSDAIVVIGECPRATHRQFAVRVTLGGWVGGVVPLDSSFCLPASH
jgi:hypothetical protein